MESRGIITNSRSKNPTKTQKKLIKIIPLAILSAILVSLLLNNSHSRNHRYHPALSLSSPLHSFLKKACPETPHSSLCRSTIIPTSSNFTLTVLDFAINLTVNHAKKARTDIKARFKNQDLNIQQRNALQDCMDMLDQTLYELEQAIDELGSSPSLTLHNIKTLLSAAMTNENTCTNGFLESGLDGPMGHGERLRNLLSPISQMISNSLVLIKHVEKIRFQESVEKPKMMMITKGLREEKYPNYLRIVRRRRKKKTTTDLRPNVTVASDGSGNYSIIREAIAMAPNKSSSSYIIKIKAGVYRENVVVPREKINVMLIGDGMNRTIITGSRNFVDGFSTFESATLTVVGDKFLARDLTIENTSSPEKHQAVALRVTSNAAFSHCEIKSNQDTLYAHSLRQFYHNCVIQGTIDFIFGNAAAVFQNCTILVRKPMLGQSNTITAQGREDPNQNTGFVIQNCRIEAGRELDGRERKKIATYLGRPWRNYSRTVVVNSYLGGLIDPRGWVEWAVYSNGDRVEYIECMNYGPGADTRGRVGWAGYRKNCSEDVVRRFDVQEFLHGPDPDAWLYSTVLPLFLPS